MFFSLFYPKKCIFCSKPSNTQVCVNCLDKTNLMYQPFCVVCQNQSFEGLTHLKCKKKYSPEFTIVPFLYKGITKSIIVKSKYSQNSFSLAHQLLNYSFTFKEQFNYHKLSDFTVVPVPGSADRVNKRGFNLPDLLAKELSKFLNLPYSNTLKRTKNVPALYKLKKRQRQQAVKNTFVCSSPNFKKALIVDDILTSGSTLLESCKTLKKAGVQEVACFSLAYRPLNEID